MEHKNVLLLNKSVYMCIFTDPYTDKSFVVSAKRISTQIIEHVQIKERLEHTSYWVNTHELLSQYTRAAESKHISKPRYHSKSSSTQGLHAVDVTDWLKSTPFLHTVFIFCRL